MPVIIPLADPAQPTGAFLEECLERLRRGELVAGPTDTVYGLFCDPFLPAALERLAALKARPEPRPIPLLVSGREQAEALAASVPSEAARLMDAFWPGALTIVLAARPTVPAAVSAGSGSVGLRQPASGYLLRLVESMGGPLTGTSANRPGGRPAASAVEVVSALGEEVDAVIDGGSARRREGSTVVEVTPLGVRVIRLGVVGLEELASVSGPLLEGS